MVRLSSNNDEQTSGGGFCFYEPVADAVGWCMVCGPYLLPTVRCCSCMVFGSHSQIQVLGHTNASCRRRGLSHLWLYSPPTFTFLWLPRRRLRNNIPRTLLFMEHTTYIRNIDFEAIASNGYIHLQNTVHVFKTIHFILSYGLVWWMQFSNPVISNACMHNACTSRKSTRGLLSIASPGSCMSLSWNLEPARSSVGEKICCRK